MPQQDRNVVGSGTTRRDFMKASAAIAGAAALAIPASGVYAQASAEIKIGLIGCGGRGSGAADQALLTNKSVGPCKLIAVADAFEDQAKRSVEGLKGQHGDKVDVPADRIFVGFDAYKKVIESGPDMLVIATPPGFRPIHFDAAIKAGKHVFMEKPVATDAVGVRQILETAKLAKEKNLKVGVGLQRHHQASYIDTVKRIQDGAIGDLILMRAYWNGDRPWVRKREDLKRRKPDLTEMEYQMRNWYYFNWLCGDHINEQHIHNLDVINWVKNGPPVRAQGVGGRAYYDGPDQGEIFDHHMVEFTYADGTRLLSECRHQPNTWGSVSEHAHGTKGYADISGSTINVKGGETWRHGGPGGRRREPNPYEVEHEDLSKAIRNNTPYNEAEYGAHSTMTAIMGRMATYSGLEIFWDSDAAKKAGRNPEEVPRAIESKLNLQPDSYAWDAMPKSLPDKNGLYRLPRPGDRSYPAF